MESWHVLYMRDAVSNTTYMCYTIVKQTHPEHWISKSPVSQIYLVVESPTSFGRVTCLPPKNSSAPWDGVGSRWVTIIVWQIIYVQYLFPCQKLQRSTPYNIVKNGPPWKRVFCRCHLGRQVTAVTCLRWPIVMLTDINFKKSTMSRSLKRNL